MCVHRIDQSDFHLNIWRSDGSTIRSSDIGHLNLGNWEVVCKRTCDIIISTGGVIGFNYQRYLVKDEGEDHKSKNTCPEYPTIPISEELIVQVLSLPIYVSNCQLVGQKGI